jgi:hypothetical protein
MAMRRGFREIASRSIPTQKSSNTFNPYRQMSTSTGDSSGGKEKETPTRLRLKDVKHPSSEAHQEEKKNYYNLFAQVRSISVLKYLQLLDKHSQEFIPENSKVCMRINPSVLEHIITTNDSFKSMHVTNTSDGLLDNETRITAERDRIGNYSLNTPPEDRPIFGYVATSKQPLDKIGLDQYGRIAIVFKDEVKQRTTFTVGDSLDNLSVRSVPLETPNGDCFPLWPPVKVTDSIETIMKRDPLNKRFEDLPSYVEAQIHKGVAGVSLKDVERVILAGDTSHDKELIRLLDKAKIPYQTGSPDLYRGRA